MKHNYKATHKRLSTMTMWRAGMTVEGSETVLHALWRMSRPVTLRFGKQDLVKMSSSVGDKLPPEAHDE